MPLILVTNHQANSTSPQRLEPPLLVLISQLPRHSLLADFTIEREIMPCDGNSQQSFATLYLKPFGHIKTRVHTAESHVIQQPLDMKRPVEVAGGAFQND
jgi:hypothetical protein